MKKLKLEIDYETADKITVLNLKDAYDYLSKQQVWFESDEETRKKLEKKWGHTMWVHPVDYAETSSKILPALKTVLHYYGA